MELQLQRHAPIGEALPGDFFVDGARFSFSLERTSLKIAAGRYPVLFTVSDRAKSGELWSPDAQHRLPLIDQVVGRSGLRIHAANFSYELVGCIALGGKLDVDRLIDSRVGAVIPFIARFAAATGTSWIIIIDAGAP